MPFAAYRQPLCWLVCRNRQNLPRHTAMTIAVTPSLYRSLGQSQSHPIVPPTRSATKNTYLKDKFHRLKARRGYLRAAVAIGHKILTAVYVMFSNGVEYRDLGTGYLDAIDSRRISGNLVRRLQRLGYDVTLSPRAQTAGAPVEA